MKTEKVLITLKIRKRHILIFILLLFGALLIYSDYFREYMTLPQSAAVMLADAPIDLKNKKLLIFAPHCDDEVLGQAGVIERAISQSSEVKVVNVTDCNKHRIGPVREQETLSALAVLGVSKGVQFWDFSEGREKSPLETDQLKHKMISLLSSYNPDYIFVPHPNDTHIDHNWVGKTYLSIDQSLRPKDKSLYYLIHYNFLKYPSPPGLKPDDYLTPPIKLIKVHQVWYKFMLTTQEEDLKEEAVLKHKSQLKVTNPVLNRVLLDFIRKNELFMMEK